MALFKPGDFVIIGKINNNNTGLLWPSGLASALAVVQKEILTSSPKGPVCVVRMFDSNIHNSFYPSELSLYEPSPLEKIIYGL